MTREKIAGGAGQAARPLCDQRSCLWAIVLPPAMSPTRCITAPAKSTTSIRPTAMARPSAACPPSSRHSPRKPASTSMSAWRPWAAWAWIIITGKNCPCSIAPGMSRCCKRYSTLDADRPGNPSLLIDYARKFDTALHARNPDVKIYLDATWSCADLTYPGGMPWHGSGIEQMALDVAKGYDAARKASPGIADVVPVGLAWNRAFAAGVAGANPYDGIPESQINLWASDNHHASNHGYYLEALAGVRQGHGARSAFAGSAGNSGRRSWNFTGTGDRVGAGSPMTNLRRNKPPPTSPPPARWLHGWGLRSSRRGCCRS